MQRANAFLDLNSTKRANASISTSARTRTFRSAGSSTKTVSTPPEVMHAHASQGTKRTAIVALTLTSAHMTSISATPGQTVPTQTDPTNANAKKGYSATDFFARKIARNARHLVLPTPNAKVANAIVELDSKAMATKIAPT